MSVRIEHGDCREVIPRLVAEGVVVDAVVTDPPYHLISTVNRFGGLDIDANTATSRRIRTKADGMARMAQGFMNQKWDGGDIAFRPETWATIGTVMRTGGFLLAFGGTRTEHRLACAIEDAGFVIEDKFLWIHGQGFPKNKNLLKPACEIVTIAYRPGAPRVRQIDECRIEAGSRPWHEARRKVESDETRVAYGKGLGSLRAVSVTEIGRWPTNFSHDGSDEVLSGFPDSFGQQGDVRGTEPSRTGDNGIYGQFGRVPFNKRVGEASAERRYTENGGTDFAAMPGERRSRQDSGSAARFFYQAKADREDRWGSKHPTVKPVELIKHLVALHCKPGGLFLDCFAGSGTAGVAALATGRNAILIEQDAGYIADIRNRMAHYEGVGSHSLVTKNRKAREKTGPLL